MTEGAQGTFKGSILVRDGKIAEVGENVMVPAGATVIDAAGQWVIPGIIDCHSHIAVRWRHQRRQRFGVVDGEYQRRDQPGRHRDLSRAGWRRDGGEYSARVGQRDRRADAWC